MALARETTVTMHQITAWLLGITFAIPPSSLVHVRFLNLSCVIAVYTRVNTDAHSNRDSRPLAFCLLSLSRCSQSLDAMPITTGDWLIICYTKVTESRRSDTDI
jgi:hypothetical protein